MADLDQTVQQSLLTRLTDDQPRVSKDSPVSLAQSVESFRASVLRELQWLLNTTRTTVDVQEDRFPEVARSVLVYGLPDVGSMSATSKRDESRLLREVRVAIERFEPRIREPRVTRIKDEKDGPLVIRLSIEGLLCMDPSPERIIFDTQVEISSGRIRVGGGDDAG